jgi:hypothetical protein
MACQSPPAPNALKMLIAKSSLSGLKGMVKICTLPQTIPEKSSTTRRYVAKHYPGWLRKKKRARITYQ